MKRKILLLFSILPILAFSQTDTEFWFACPDLSATHFEACIKLQIMSFDKPAVVTITQPANPSFVPITHNLGAYDDADIPLGSFLNIVETRAGGIRTSGLLIKSTANISAYYANTCDNSEIYSLKGRNALGTEFLVPTQYEFDSSVGYGGGSSIEIVASEDNTEVTIVPTKDCVGHPANVPFTIRLNKGNSYAVRTSGMLALDHLFNTVITSTKPIAVNYTDDSLAGPGVDLIGDQIIPNSLLGTKYIAVRNDKGNTNRFDKVYIFPIVDNTTISVDGTYLTTLNKGDKTVVNLTSNVATLITSNNPISVLQTTYNGNELGASVLPSLLCTGSREISYKPTQYTARVTIVTKTENIGYFTMNGNSFSIPASRFIPLTADATWSYYRQDISSTSSMPVMEIKNSRGVFHAGFFDNPGTTCSYGYFSNYNITTIDGISTEPYFIEGQNLTLHLKDSAEIESLIWTLPDGTTQIADSLTINSADVTNNGMYIINGVHRDGCLILPDTMFVSVFPKDIQKNESVFVCKDNNFTLTSEGYAPYTWSNSASASNNIELVADVSKIVTATSYKKGVNMAATLPDTLCKTNSKSIFEYTLPTKIVANNYYLISANVTYKNGTTAPSDVFFTINGSRIGANLQLSQPNDYISSERTWLSDVTTVKIGIESDSGNDLCVTNISFAPLFAFVDTFTVVVSDSLKPAIEGDVAICNNSASLTVNQSYDTYLWSTGAVTKDIMITAPGNYWVKVTNGDCNGTAYVTIAPSPALKILIDQHPEICENDVSVISLPFEETEGNVKEYSIYFENQEVFSNVENKQVHNKNIEIPLNLTNRKPGIYNALLKVTEVNCGTISEYPIVFVIKYPSTIITQRWNDVVSVKNKNFNGGYSFNAYQWYKNGNKIDGATKSYYYSPQIFSTNPSDKFSVMLTNDKGEQIETCEFETVYLPNTNFVTLVGRRQYMALPVEKGIITIWTATGTIYSTQKFVDNQYLTPDIKGIYILQINNEEKMYKIMVRD